MGTSQINCCIKSQVFWGEMIKKPSPKKPKTRFMTQTRVFVQ